jgi:hypothetical protein
MIIIALAEVVCDGATAAHAAPPATASAPTPSRRRIECAMLVT